jgi:hypothetical protein
LWHDFRYNRTESEDLANDAVQPGSRYEWSWIENGKIKEIKEYCDSTLVERARAISGIAQACGGLGH